MLIVAILREESNPSPSHFYRMIIDSYYLSTSSTISIIDRHTIHIPAVSFSWFIFPSSYRERTIGKHISEDDSLDSLFFPILKDLLCVDKTLSTTIA